VEYCFLIFINLFPCNQPNQHRVFWVVKSDTEFVVFEFCKVESLTPLQTVLVFETVSFVHRLMSPWRLYRHRYEMKNL